jgi:hypothetical protein
MRRRSSRLLTATAAVSVIVLVVACEAKVYGTTGTRTTRPQPTAVTPQASVDLAPVDDPDQPGPIFPGPIFPGPIFDGPAPAPAPVFDGLDVRAHQATADAAQNGADISALVLDRTTGMQVSNGNGRSLAIASVVKLFIADDLLLQEAKGQTQLSPADRASLDSMLRSSDDGAAETFWDRGGGGAIVTRVAARYGLTATSPPGNGRWFNTISTAADLVKYYDELLAGTGGLPPDRASIIIDNLAQSTPQGLDGYPQRFGIPEGLYGEPVAVKQGWMCCIGTQWMHLSTGIIGPDRRYIMVIGSMQTADDATARATITQAVKTMFPTGQI